MTLELRNERGVALIVSIIGLVVVGALMTGVFATGLVEQRVGENTRWMERSFAAAEYGLSETVANWNVGAFNQLPVGAAVNVAGAAANGAGTYVGTVRRLNQEQFIVDVTGRDAGNRGRQRLGAFVKLRPIHVDIQAALTTRGDTRVGGNAKIDASDHLPIGWTGCPPLDPMLAGIRTPDDTKIKFGGGCPAGTCVTGNPKVDEDPTVGDDTFFDYGDIGWPELTGMANKVLPPGTYTGVDPILTGGGECDVVQAKNWGAPLDPLSPCHGYFPIVYVPGSLVVNGNSGQGLLLIEGDLEAQGGFEFFGIVIVKGSLKTTGTGAHFNGGVLAANVDLDQVSVLGDATINYSGCAVARALNAGSPGAQLRSRGWVQLY